MLRAVIDTNQLVGALARRGGASDRILKQWRAGVFEHVASEATLREAELVVGSRWVERLGGRKERDDLLAKLRQESIIVDAPILEELTPKDAGDRRLVEAAHAGRARYLVTADREVLLMWGYGGVEFMAPDEFLRALAQSDQPLSDESDERRARRRFAIGDIEQGCRRESTCHDLYVSQRAVLEDLLVPSDQYVPERPGCCDEYAIRRIAGRTTGQRR